MTIEGGNVAVTRDEVAPLGQMAAGIVHDFNHVLNIIRGYTELLLGELEENDAAHEKLLQVRKAVDRGASLTRELLAVSRREAFTVIPLDVNRLIEDLLESLEPLLAGRIELLLVLDSKVGLVSFDPGKLQGVVMNLVANACDAMPNGGRLTIKTARADFGRVESRTGAVALVSRWLLTTLSRRGLSPVWLGSVSCSRSSNRTGRFPASGSRKRLTPNEVGM
jgi:signal transduction histidine kinase